ncbi:alpha/beta fold hydrolase [Auraticoccus monumenti]|uniref:Pimeloyl-ACP methyl ester carboxylesterase n=1 Tax=Auraticoccus monumenti TaxID=675864 RepID=A0A1G7AYV4_9ACTN|nr:alpha/beta fold hydrolase [Auraticoccus monumenti]SDE19963.1 Pimeloyl-ACP methyl ester carboxylesterase [Auraticoccus monumenti]
MPELHTTTLGTDGPLVAFCHGLFGQGRNWTQVAKALAGENRVLMVDLPNHGRSAWTDRVDHLDMADRVATLFSADDPVTLVGHSMGGKVAMALALRHPELVERLAVVDVAPVTYPRMSTFAGYVAAMRSVDLASTGSRAEAEEGLRAGVPDPVVRGFLLQNLRRSEDPSGGAGWRWQMNLQALGDQLEAIGAWPEQELAGVEPYAGPTVWIGGQDSDYITAEHEAAMRRWFPRTRRVSVKGAGHWVHSEQPEAFLSVLWVFLRG